MKKLSYYLEVFEREGCVVIPDFLTSEELSEIKSEIARIVGNLNTESFSEIPRFKSTNDQVLSHKQYFLDSADKISFFFEDTAVDEPQLKVGTEKYLNKIGHALHWLSPTFKKVSFKEEVKTISKQLGFVEPSIIQSMYIFKNPSIGGEISPHIDRTFLYNDPCKLVGFWIPIEDATLENGCLWYVPGSHKSENVTKRMVRSSDGEQGNLLTFIGEQRHFEDDEFVSVPVKAGGLVLIHGKVIHKSERNLSLKARPAYTFHVIDHFNSVYSTENWLQPTEELPFTRLYDN